MFSQIKLTLSRHFILFLTLGITLLVYARFLFFGHISWDDPEMVFKNKWVQEFDLKALFSRHFVGNYIPVTMLGHALSWMLFKSYAGGHHVFIIVLHLLNGVLVYLLGKRLFKNETISSIGVICFLLHPLQMESVGWISELKNVLSSAFYLAGLLSYLDYSDRSKKRDYLRMLMFFVLGCLSKSSVIVFPLSLLCIDVLIHQKISYKFLLNKLPLIPLSVLFGWINLNTQATDLFINYAHAFPYYQRIGYAGYALGRYMLLFLIPVNLSVIYPYPPNIPAALVTGYILLAALAGLLVFILKKKKFNLVALVLFTLVNLALVLQFVPFGEVLYADRYMYIPVIGLGWMAGLLLSRWQLSLKGISLALILTLGLLSFFRANVWRSAITLYEDILKNFPNSFVALNSVGVEYMLHNNTEKAFYYLDRSIAVAPYNYKGFYNRGLLYLKDQQPKQALLDFNKAIDIYSYSKAYVGRASVYQLLGDIPKAINDATHVLSTEPGNAKAHFILANCYNDLNKLEEALQEYDLSVKLDPSEAEFYFKRGIVYGKMQNFDASIRDMSLCLSIDPSFYEANYWRGVASINLRINACDDFKMAARQNYQPAISAYHKYCGN